MNFSIKGTLASKTVKLNTQNKITTLNPNAAEFVPSALRTPSVSTTDKEVASLDDVSGNSGKAILDRSESTVSNNSDEEAHQYWRRQLPDDITPDFKFMEGDELQGLENLSMAGLTINDGIETSRSSVLAGGGQLLSNRPGISSHNSEGISLTEKMKISIPMYVEDQSSEAFMPLTATANPWDKGYMGGDQHLNNRREAHPYNEDGYLNELFNEQVALDDNGINPVEFLAMEFPGFSAESLADVYYANNCDLGLTIEMLTQLELQVDGGLNQNPTPRTLSAPKLTPLDFPALPVPSTHNDMSKYTGSDQQAANPYQSIGKDSFHFGKSISSSTSRSATDFASAVRRLASQESSPWKYERNSSSDINAGSSRSSQLLASSYSGNGRSMHSDWLQNNSAVRATPVWLETGEAVANMYSESREEARDHARLRNACFEQARQAYLIGNRALAKELSAKGQLHNLQMKAAHGKARESIFRQRNPVSALDFQNNGRGGQERLIDLHGLHVSEAIHVLKHELSILRNTARYAGQRLQVFICVGTGHHTKGSRTPARLPVAVQRYLLEEEGLDYTEPQLGLLRVVIY